MYARVWERVRRVSMLAGLLVIATANPSMQAMADPAVPGQFRAACVKVDITPDTPQWLHGYGPRQSEGVHDRIYHRIAAMDDGATTFFLVSTDICTISPSFYRRLLQETGARDGHQAGADLVVDHPHPFGAPCGAAEPGPAFRRNPWRSVLDSTRYGLLGAGDGCLGEGHPGSPVAAGTRALGYRLGHGPRQCEPPRAQRGRADRLGRQSRRAGGPPDSACFGWNGPTAHSSA